MLIFYFFSSVILFQEKFDFEGLGNQHQLTVVNERAPNRRHMSYEFITYRGGWLEMLHSPRIQSELKIDKKTAKKFDDLLSEKRQKKSAYLMQFEWDQWDREKTPMSQLRAAGKFLSELNRKFDREALSQISKEKHQRLNQLFVWELAWRHGIASLLLDKQLANNLGITARQKEKMISFSKEFKKSTLRELRELHVFIREEFESALTRKTRKRIRDVLGDNEFKKGWGLESAEVLATQNAWGLDSVSLKRVGLVPMKCSIRVPLSIYPELSVVQRNDRLATMLGAGYRDQLELTDEQIAQMTKVYRVYQTERNKLHKSFYSIAPGEREPYRKKFLDDSESLTEKYNEFVNTELLLPHQVTLFDNVYYLKQLRSIGLFRLLVDRSDDNDFPKKIDISNKEIANVREKQIDVVSNIIKKRNEIQQKYFDGLCELLSGEQREKIQKLLGPMPKEEPFPELTTFLLQIEQAIETHTRRASSGSVEID
jgi:hypothetical protein